MKQALQGGYPRIALAALLTMAGATIHSSHAAMTDVATSPLGTATSGTVVRPNIMFILDTSGSMNADFVPDPVNPPNQLNAPTDQSWTCRSDATGQNACVKGDPPYYADKFNGMAYNPQFTYRPGVNADGTSRGSYTKWTKVDADSYDSTKGTIDLTVKFPEMGYCNWAGNVCKRNGVDNGTTFSYATPARPTITGVKFTRTTTTVTATKTGHTVNVGDVIDIVGAGSCSGYDLTVTATTSTTFSVNWGTAASAPACSGVTGSVVYSTRGYPEFHTGGQVASTGSSGNASKPSTTTVTFVYPNHGLAVGDVIDVEGPSGNCTSPATGSVVIAVPNANTFTFSGVTTSGGNCGGSSGTPNMFTFSRRVQFQVNGGASQMSKSSSNVTVTWSNHAFVLGDVVDVINGSDASCQTPSGGSTVNGVTASTLTFAQGSSGGSCSGTYLISRRPYTTPKTLNGTPLYYTLSANEFCADIHLTDCVASTVATSSSGKAYTYPAYVRYCSSLALANQAPAVSTTSGTPLCIDKYVGPTYVYPRYGTFTRGDIVSGTTTYSNRPSRWDCKNAPICTYTEEMTNFANWYAYYRRRIQAMKSSAGISFQGLDDRSRVGFITINPSSPVVACTGSSSCASKDEFLSIANFDATQKSKFYSIFYQQTTGGGTPLRSALSRVGRYFAHKTDAINNGMNDDPVQYSCQQNFALLTTDGYWKDAAGVQLDGKTAIGNQDGSTSDTSGLVSRAAGTWDGGCAAGDVDNGGGCANTLADVAMYYYKNDLRNTSLGNTTGSLGSDVSVDNVPTSDQDKATWQHLTTFTLGLADGQMTWQSDYATATTGDFKNITSGSSGCYWSGAGSCNWPTVTANTPSALDDLWHAAVNGHGTYFHANDPQSLSDGLTGALGGMSARTAAAAASATSSPNVTQQDNVVYSTTYTTAAWNGELVAQYIDPANGNVLPAVLWSAQGTLDGRTADTTDSRTIYTFDGSASSKLKSFDYSVFNATERGWIDNACVPASKLSQCIFLAAPDLVTVNSGANIVNFVRGRTTGEGSLYRDRKHALGDTVNATPAYVRSPRYSFADAVTPSYSVFKNANATRQPVLYLGANDGMLHAFDASVGSGSNGTELWAYVPRMLIPNLYKLADKSYAAKHQYYVDGSPTVMDAYWGGAWHTVLVSGLNAGGRGYFALDVTNPTSPQALWEFCSDSTLCAVSDADLGYTFGNPIITKRADGRPVVLLTSGYNNVSPGTGVGFLYVVDLVTGAVLEKVTTGAGSTTTPSGLGKIGAYADNFQQNNTVTYVYGGDLRGNIWRFDLTKSSTSVQQLGTLTDAASRPQSITTRPELGYVNGGRVVFIGTGRYLGLSDLSDPATWIPASTDAYQQSLYAFKDTGTNLGNLRTSGSLVQQTIKAVDALTRTVTNNAVDWTSNNGWYVDFNPANASPGERVNIDMQLTLGTLSVKTNVPSSSACTAGGDSWVYQFRYDTGSYVATAPGQVVAQKITGATTVGFVIVGLPGGGLKDITTDATSTKRTFGVNIGGNAGSGKRIGWRELSR